MLAANASIYGTGDAGRTLYKGFRADAIAAGFRECGFVRSCYVYEVDGDIKVMMGANVDKYRWAAKPGYAYIMDRLLERFEVNLTEALSNTEDADLSKTVLQLQQEQNVFQSALVAGQTIIQPTLIDFFR